MYAYLKEMNFPKAEELHCNFLWYIISTGQYFLY